MRLRFPTLDPCFAFGAWLRPWGASPWARERGTVFTVAGLCGRCPGRRVGSTVDDPEGLAAALRAYLKEPM
jgi:hypothetical protein